MRISILLSLLILICTATGTVSAQTNSIYKNPGYSIEQRTADLLSRMTVEEKIGQLLCPMGWEMWEKKGEDVKYSAKFKQLIDSSFV